MSGRADDARVYLEGLNEVRMRGLSALRRVGGGGAARVVVVVVACVWMFSASVCQCEELCVVLAAVVFGGSTLLAHIASAIR
jgi:hypothetical protein